MKLDFPFWVGQVDTEGLPTWCGVILLITIIVGVVLLLIAIIKEVRE